MGSTDGDPYKSWSWWLDALQAMRTYSIPMDAKEARIRADAEEATKETAAAHRAAAEEARRKHQLKEELEAVRKWVATGDPEAAAYRMKRLNEDHLEMFMRRSAEDGDPYAEEDHSDPAARQASTYRRNWKSGTTCGRVLSTAPSSTRLLSRPCVSLTCQLSVLTARTKPYRSFPSKSQK
ncbi:uncharacterized protein [Triticum aestivum]|uniref:uncharacterized protein n=1 Tax=Triticum aestivum TaxID=4565 RepID=UPI001D008AED|nr:uncharacterized protein LOC123133536 [Triticum aestivum]